MERESLLDSIQRLIALGSSPNEHEAKAALAKAAELMARHNIAMAEVESFSESATSDWSEGDAFVGRSQPWESPFLVNILHGFFFVRCIHVRIDSLETAIRLFGRPSNIEVGVYVYHVLLKTYRRLARERGIIARNRRGYYMGLTEGFKAKLRAERDALNAAESTALVVVGNQLMEAFRAQHPDIGKARETVVRVELTAYERGLRDGRQINLRDALKGKQQQFLPTGREALT